MKKRFAIPMLVLSSTLILGGLTACNEPSTSVTSKQNFTGIGIPSDALGNDGDTYKDESSGDLYVKEDGHWVIKQVAKALSGEGAPSDTIGNDGDTYEDTLSGATYKKVNGHWELTKKGDTTYVVTFNLNGGHFANGETTLKDQIVREGRWVKKPSMTPIKEHCEFLGWFAEGSNQAWNFIGQSVYGNVNLVAKYRVKDEDKIIVTVNPNNGEATYTYETFVGDYYYPSIPTKAGFSFIGWYIDGEKYNGYVTSSMSGATIIAQFEKSKFNLAYQVEENDEVTITGILDLNAVSIDVPSQINGRKVTKIAKTAFASRISLETIYLPASIKVIEDGAFANTRRLAAINVDSANLNFASVNGVLYSKDMSVLYLYPTKAGESFDVPNSVKRIGNFAFYATYDMGISSIKFNEGLEEIGDYAFAYNQTLNALSLPKSLRKIGKSAFMGMANSSEDDGSYISPQGIITNAGLNEGLEEIGEMAFANQYFKETFKLPSTVKVLGDYAFANCTAIEKVVLPDSLVTFGRNAFAGATGIGEYAISSSNPNFTVSDKMLFSKDMKKLVSAPSNLYEDITLPEGVEEIGDFGFYMVDEVKNYNLPSTLKKIGEQAFAHTYELSSFTIPDSVTQIGENCFDLSGISSITIGKGLTEIPKEAFIETKLSEVVIPGNVKKIGNGAFYLCSSLTKLTLENGVNEIGMSSFGAGPKLTSLDMPDSLTKIGDSAFSGNKITTLSIKKGLTSIGANAFYNQNSGTSLDYLIVDAASNSFKTDSNILYSKDGKNVILATNKAGSESSGTYTVNLLEGVENIGDFAFAYCKNISTFNFPTSLISIGNGAFMNTRFKNATLPSKLTSIGDGAFYMSSVNNITFNEGLLSIGESSFAFGDLVNVTLPSSLRSIGKTAFAKNISLTSLTLGNKLESIGDFAFVDTKISSVINIPATCVNIGDGVFASNVSTYGQSIDDIIVSEDNPKYASVDGFLLSKNKEVLYSYAAGISGDINVPEGVKEIAKYGLALAGSRSTRVALPATLTTIGEGGLAYLSKVTSALNVPSTVSYIGANAFAYWTSNQLIKFGVSEDYALTNYDRNFKANCSAKISYGE